MFELHKLEHADEVLVLPYPDKGKGISLNYDVIRIPNYLNKSDSKELFINPKSKLYKFYNNINFVIRHYGRIRPIYLKISFAVCNNKLCVIRWDDGLYDIWIEGIKKFSDDGRLYENYSTNKFIIVQDSLTKEFSKSYLTPNRFLLPFESNEDYLNDPDIINLKKEFDTFVESYNADNYLDEIYSYLYGLDDVEIKNHLVDFSIKTKVRKLKLEKILNE